MLHIRFGGHLNLLFLLFWFMVNSSFGQEKLLQETVIIEKGTYDQIDIIRLVERQLGVNFAYSPASINPEKTFSYEEGIFPLSEILNDVFPVSEYVIGYKNRKFLIKGKFEDEQNESSKFTISGHVTDSLTGETLIGANIYIPEIKQGTRSNPYGFYSITLPEGVYQLLISFIGYERQILKIDLHQNIQFDFPLIPNEQMLQEIEVTTETEEENQNVENAQMSMHSLDQKFIESIPALVGEGDAIKAIQLLPGIQSMTEGSSGLIVRGGGRDQNLMLLDEAPVYNPAHLFGFYSVFNPDALKDLKIYKGAFPASYGGRLSSVMDVRMKEGNNQSFGGSGGIGLISSRLTLEGPLKKDKGSFMLSGRRTYADVFLKLDPNDGGNDVYFYDLNAKLNYKIDSKNTVFLSGYFGRDVLRFFNQYEANWGNATGTLRWNHIFNDRLFSNFSLIYSDFHYQMLYFSEAETVNTFSWNSGIRDLNGKADFTYFVKPNLTTKFGANVIHHRFDPGNNPETPDQNVPTTNALESAFYLANEHQIGEKLALEYGIRFSIFQNIGNAKVYQFDENYQVTDSVQHSGGVYQTFSGIEPRLNIRYLLKDNQSLKLSYTRSLQYLQTLTNASLSFSAFDIHIPASPNIEPLIGDQVSLGYFRNLKDNQFEFSVEAYYKNMANVIDYIDHASLVQNPYLEGEIRAGNGKSYGLEFFLKKNTGNLTGWVGYTLSKAFLKIEAINEGKQYNAPYDQPYSFKAVINYQKSTRWQFSGNWVYSTGNAINLPVGTYNYEGKQVPIYGERNLNRLPNYHRLDLSATLFAKKNQFRKFQSSWTFALYNAYGRINPISVNFLPEINNEGKKIEPQHIVARKTYLFSIVPAITYNFKF